MIIQGKVGFVTGGAQGIGRAICEALLQKGAKVIIADIDAAKGKLTASELATEYADNITFIECDVTNQESVEDALGKAKDTYGRLDIIGNNAGAMMENDPIGTINLNLCGVMRVAAVAMGYMRADKGGSSGVIVNTASYAGLMPFATCPAYCASKYGVVGFTRSFALSQDYDLHKVRMVCLCPGMVDTSLLSHLSEEGEKDGFILSYEEVKDVVNKPLKPSAVADVFIDLVEDESKNGAAMLITLEGPPRDIEFPCIVFGFFSQVKHSTRQRFTGTYPCLTVLRKSSLRKGTVLCIRFGSIGNYLQDTEVHDTMIIQDKVAFVTGGAQGIGRAICEALLKKGAKVIIADINVTEGKSTASEFATEYADNVTFIECDVTNQESVEDAFRKANDKYGRVDIIGNNAGALMENDPIGTINLNLCGEMRVAAVAMRYMRADKGGGGGIIINMASYCGIMPYFACPSYCASKYGIVGFTRSIAMSPDFDVHKVRMNCLCPDTVDTALVRRVSKEGEKKGFIFHYDHVKDAANQPMLKPPAVADVFIDLVEDESKNGAAVLIPRKGPPRDIEFPVYQ
ncbi:uncharacterized protein LOC106182030 [Lingula anatina]|uniref:15-hydroxyprostaglandin dehydrogenase [NAD(+)] n=1 Tax=Lingula anatina TaxID=7574 RepID=A0A1S3KI14_LINAN|nr:uncharacterized protein LOC106182030 [Lingula anatina]|eukprot:XP_013422114.1 uncharacterized protein LOC106182030 [Lingula anatina]